ncbi:MAG: hypothetical protein JKY60_14995 [Kordiimonadaceae bacterium]|nr:hypothetical protein [Kordiimonadaceae bacterium]
MLTESDISKLTLVRESQIKAWETGVEDVPEGTAGLLADINREIEKRVAKAMKAAAQKETVTLIRFPNFAVFRRAGPDMKPIPSFLAFKCHCALIMRLRMAIARTGREITVCYYSETQK